MDRQQCSDHFSDQPADRGRHWKNALLATAATLLSLIALDTALRYTELTTPRSGTLTPKAHYRPVTARTLVFAPGYRGVLHSQDFRVGISANNRGFRERDFDRAAVAAQRSILFVGDSSFFGWGVETRQRISEQTGNALRRAGLDVPVVNMAFPGWGTFNYLDVLVAELTQLKPRLVVIGSFIGNDIIDDQRLVQLSEPSVAGSVGKASDGGVSIKALIREFLRTSPISILVKRVAWEVPALRKAFNSMEVRNDRIAMYERGQGPQQDAVFAPTRLAFRAIAELCREHHVPVLLTLIPDHLQVLAPEVLVGYDITRPQRVLTDLGSDLGLHVVDLLPVFLAAPDRSTLYFREDKHWTAAGHSRVAEVLADHIIALLSERS